MANEFTIKALNDWRAAITPTLDRALRISIDVWGRNADEATLHMLILMAQSAGAMTPQSQKVRTVYTNSFGPFVTKYKQNGKKPSNWYKWQFEDMANEKAAEIRKMYRGSDVFGNIRGRRKGTWEDAHIIKNRGLAKRSWLWGLSSNRKPIAGTSEVFRIKTQRLIGWQKTNKLSYIDKIMPPGYEQMASQKAMNKLLKNAEMKMVRDYERSIGRVA